MENQGPPCITSRLKIVNPEILRISTEIRSLEDKLSKLKDRKRYLDREKSKLLMLLKSYRFDKFCK